MFRSFVRRLYAHYRSQLYLKNAKAKFSSFGKTFGVQEACCRNVKKNYLQSRCEKIRMGHTKVQNTWQPEEDERRELMALWPDIVSEITETDRYCDIPDIKKRLKEILEYNVPGGKQTRTISLINAYRLIVPSELLTEENIRLARTIAWTLEISQAFLLMMDDIVDRSQIRRKRLCWYLRDDIGLGAINDASMLENIPYQLLRTYLKGKDCYIDIVELLHETIMRTAMGQCLDLLSANFGKKVNLDLFTMDRFNAIAKYKTSYYTFLLPIRTAMYLAGLRDPKMHSQIEPILLEMGHYYQVQNDYWDCYEDPNITGKNGSDIEEGKCTWLIVIALQRATPEQRKILDASYGSKDPEKVKLVKRVYNEIGLSHSYFIYEQETYNRLITRIQKLACGLPNDLFLNFVEKIRS